MYDILAWITDELTHTCSQSHRSMTTTHRPTPAPKPSPYRTVPLMQSFRTSAPSPIRMEARTIDAAVLPASLFAWAPEADALAPGVGRMPLLPDHFSPDRAALASAGLAAPEVPDAPLAAPQVLVVAAHPENVTPSVLTEVEGMGVDGVELKFAHDPLEAAGGVEDGQGMLRDLWRGLVDDVFGESGKKVAALRS